MPNKLIKKKGKVISYQKGQVYSYVYTNKELKDVEAKIYLSV